MLFRSEDDDQGRVYTLYETFISTLAGPSEQRVVGTNIDTYDQCEKASFGEILYTIRERRVPGSLGRENDCLINSKVNHDEQASNQIDKEVRYPDERVRDAGFNQ